MRYARLNCVITFVGATIGDARPALAFYTSKTATGSRDSLCFGSPGTAKNELQ